MTYVRYKPASKATQPRNNELVFVEFIRESCGYLFFVCSFDAIGDDRINDQLHSMIRHHRDYV